MLLSNVACNTWRNLEAYQDFIKCELKTYVLTASYFNMNRIEPLQNSKHTLFGKTSYFS